MKEGLKKDLLRIYVLIFCITSFFSSCGGMYAVLIDIPFLNNIPIYEELLLIVLPILHIGTYLLMFSGRLKDKD